MTSLARFSPRPLLALCFALLSAAGTAVASDDDPPTPWSASLAGQSDQNQSSTLTAGLHYAETDATGWALDVSHSVSPAAAADLSTTAASLDVDHAGRRAGFSLGVDRANDAGVVKATEATFGASLRGHAWHLGVDGQWRQSRFDPFRVNTNVTLRSGVTIPVNGTATCTLNNGAYGGDAGVNGDSWSVTLKHLQYRYAANDCSFDSPGLQALARANLQEFRQLARVITRRLSRIGRARGGRRSLGEYLATEWQAGALYDSGAVQWGLDYQRSRDAFEGLASSAVTASAEYSVFQASSIELELGTSQTDTVGSSAFAGVQFTTRF